MANINSEDPEVIDLVKEINEVTGGEYRSGERFKFDHSKYKSKSKKRVIEVFNKADVDIEFVSDKDDNYFARITDKNKKAP